MSNNNKDNSNKTSLYNRLRMAQLDINYLKDNNLTQKDIGNLLHFIEESRHLAQIILDSKNMPIFKRQQAAYVKSYLDMMKKQG